MIIIQTFDLNQREMRRIHEIAIYFLHTTREVKGHVWTLHGNSRQQKQSVISVSSSALPLTQMVLPLCSCLQMEQQTSVTHFLQ